MIREVEELRTSLVKGMTMKTDSCSNLNKQGRECSDLHANGWKSSVDDHDARLRVSAQLVHGLDQFAYASD